MKTRLVKKVSAPVVGAIILDGAAVVQMLNHGSSIILNRMEKEYVYHTHMLHSDKADTPPFMLCQPDRRGGNA